jgi:hypothetical protein
MPQPTLPTMSAVSLIALNCPHLPNNHSLTRTHDNCSLSVSLTHNEVFALRAGVARLEGQGWKGHPPSKKQLCQPALLQSLQGHRQAHVHSLHAGAVAGQAPGLWLVNEPLQTTQHWHQQ